MDKRDFTVIKNDVKIEKEAKPVSRQTNPITKKFVDFHNIKEEFSVIDLFKK